MNLKNTITQITETIGWDALALVGLKVLIILAAGWFIALAIRLAINRIEDRMVKQRIKEGEPPSESTKRIQTIMKLVRQAIAIVLWLVIGLVILRELDVDIAPILASAGIVGLAVGFGAQNLVRDIISGFFIILENQVRVGDVAIINGTGGLVERINFRTIVLRDLSGIVHVFPNGTISTLSNMTNDWSAYVFDIGVAYKEDTDKVVDILKAIGKELMEDKEFGPLIVEAPEVFGVDKFADSAVIIKGRIKTKPIRQWMVGRQFLRRVKQAFDREGIEIPFPHRTLYVGEESKPFDVQMLEKLQQQRDS